jgi:hypothetical protein
VRGTETRRYILDRILHRPRDIITICNAAVLHAVNGRRPRIEEEDVLAAEVAYSRFAFDALLVENGITIEVLEQVLFEFLDSSPTMTRDEVLEHVSAIPVSSKTSDEVLDHLLLLTFLGIETHDGRFDYADSEETRQRLVVLGRKAQERTGHSPNFAVHPAYRPYLEIPDHN